MSLLGPLLTPSMKRSKLQTIFEQTILCVIFLFILFPIVWVFLMAFKSRGDILSWPPTFLFEPTFDNFRNILVGGSSGSVTGATTVDFLGYFANSLIISCGAILLSILVGVPAAYAIARFQFRGKEDIAFTFLSFRFAPELLVIIPIYIIFQRMGLLDTYFGLIWVYQLITLPMIIWILRGYFEDVSVELEEACRIDGYGEFYVFRKIVLPLVKGGIAASALLAFIFAWNNFIFAMVLGGSDVQPITVGAMQFMTAEALRYGDMAAAIVLAAIPALLLAIYSQKHLIRGLSFGAVKG